MAITRIKVSNFKSFDDLEVELRPLNILVGANAAGKSNFLEVFRFVRDLAADGLENAVSIQGGMEYLTNLKIGGAKPFSLEIEFQHPETFVLSGPSGPIQAEVLATTYNLVLAPPVHGGTMSLVRDEISHRCSFTKRDYVHDSTQELGTGDLLISHRGADVTDSIRLGRSEFSDLFPADSTWKLSPEKSLLGRGGHQPHLATEIAILDFDPKLSKRATLVGGKADLEADGSNLAIVLRNILADQEKRETFVRLLKDALPFVDDLRVDHFPTKSLLISLKERFSEQTYLPASFLSDGTIHLTALVLALFFEKAAITILEEPERSIHPHLISKVASMLKDASRRKQVIVTTHNPELVRNADLEDLLLVQRDEEGFSRISRPAESTEVRTFLENDLGIDELYVQDLLGVGYGV